MHEGIRDRREPYGFPFIAFVIGSTRCGKRLSLNVEGPKKLVPSPLHEPAASRLDMLLSLPRKPVPPIPPLERVRILRREIIRAAERLIEIGIQAGPAQPRDIREGLAQERAERERQSSDRPPEP
jgi:hypothetical protein